MSGFFITATGTAGDVPARVRAAGREFASNSQPAVFAQRDTKSLLVTCLQFMDTLLLPLLSQ
jgi:hypothetical protein